MALGKPLGKALAQPLTQPLGASLPWEESGGRAYDPLLSLPSLVHGYRAGTWELNGSDVSSWTDLVGSENLDQGVAAAQPAATTSNSDFGGMATVDFRSANTEYLVAQTAAAWTFLSNGTGATVIAVMRVTSGAVGNMRLYDNNNAQAAVAGASCRITDTGPDVRLDVSNGTSLILSTLGTITTDTTSVLALRYEEGRTPTEAQVDWANSSAATADSSGAPSATDAPDALTVGRRSASATQFLNADIAELWFCNDALTNAALSAFFSYAQNTYGVA